MIVGLTKWKLQLIPCATRPQLLVDSSLLSFRHYVLARVLFSLRHFIREDFREQFEHDPNSHDTCNLPSQWLEQPPR